MTTIFKCRRVAKKQAIELPEEIEPQEKISLTDQVLVNLAYLEQLVVIGKGLSPEGSTQLKNLLKKNKDIFAWKPADMTWVPKRIIKHSLNANPSVTPVSQKRRVFCSEKSKVITKEVTEWLKARIVRPVKYHTWISNPVLVKKVDKSWRMCIDSKNINAACPKDYYPLTEIDSKIESVMGFSLKKGRKRFPRTQKDDLGPTGPYNFTPEGNFVHIPGGIERNSQCSTAGGKERKAISGTLSIKVLRAATSPCHYISRNYRTMSSPNHPTSNIKDAFSSNFSDYTTASPGNISPDPSDNLSKYLFASLAISPFHNVQVYNDANKPPILPQDPITPLAISPFYNVQVYNDANKPPIPPQNPITPPTILPPSSILSPSPLFDPQRFFVPE
nr:reverse transcriptase domain-containing protein [Tanacetum cinerariifolium]